ncbi:MAG: hypothetical protein ACYTF8_10110 [Planctomycetota bacterium]
MRVWAISGLFVALLVAGILVFSDGPEPEIDRTPKRPAAPSPLTEKEVRTYIAVWPRINQVMAAAIPAMAPGADGGVDREELGRQVRAAIAVVLENNHLTQEGWNKLARRVEHAVDVVRWRAESAGRNADLDSQIQQKEALLQLAKGNARQPIEADIEALKEQRVDTGPALLRRDVELVKSFWNDLDRIAPARGSPPRKK